MASSSAIRVERSRRSCSGLGVRAENWRRLAKPSPVKLVALLYVIQHHRAHAVHYDFRLELDGVLVSWAVPKGPSLSPKARRLGVRVPDHALSHADVEGVHGGGAVIIW